MPLPSASFKSVTKASGLPLVARIRFSPVISSYQPKISIAISVVFDLLRIDDGPKSKANRLTKSFFPAHGIQALRPIIVAITICAHIR